MVEKRDISGRWRSWKCIGALLPIIWPSHLFRADEKPCPPEDRSCPHCDFAAPAVLLLSPKPFHRELGLVMGQQKPVMIAGPSNISPCSAGDGWLREGFGGVQGITNIPKSRNP